MTECDKPEIFESVGAGKTRQGTYILGQCHN